jgi:hypothetical protein
MALFEIRTYPVYEGAMDEWTTFMESTIVPFIEERGMKVDAMFRGVEDPNVYVWIRRFSNESHREELYKAVYETDHWQTKIKPTVRRLVDVENAVVHLVEATNGSPLR